MAGRGPRCGGERWALGGRSCWVCSRRARPGVAPHAASSGGSRRRVWSCRSRQGAGLGPRFGTSPPCWPSSVSRRGSASRFSAQRLGAFTTPAPRHSTCGKGSAYASGWPVRLVGRLRAVRDQHDLGSDAGARRPRAFHGRALGQPHDRARASRPDDRPVADATRSGLQPLRSRPTRGSGMIPGFHAQLRDHRGAPKRSVNLLSVSRPPASRRRPSGRPPRYLP